MPPLSENTNRFLSALAQTKIPLLSDGAMGTVLHQRGIGFEECFDRLNLTQPSLIAGVHRAYIQAGSDIIQTNTFGANRYKLAQHGLEDKVVEINTAGVALVHQEARNANKEILIAGDVGPLGVRLAPFGRVQPEQARQIFYEQISALAATKIDLLIIETMTDLYELREAILASRQVDPCLPIVASMTFTRDDRTVLGDDPVKVARFVQELGVNVIGVNCSGGPNQLLRILRDMRHAVPEARFSVMPNAGWPEQVSGRIMYPSAPEYFSDYAISFWQAGAALIGGCCGTTPEHIAAMSQAIQSTRPESIRIGASQSPFDQEETTPAEKPTHLAQKLSAGKFVITVEMDPPRGLAFHKLQAGASLLAESGADIINVADSPMARMRMSPWAVCSIIQEKVGIETVLHFPTRGRNLLRVQGDLLAAHALGVRNVFVVMGDPTAIGEYPNAMDNFDLVPSGLIKLIKQGFNTGVDHAGANIGQPTSFFVGCALNLNPQDLKLEMKNLQRKLRAGADFILSQPVFQPSVVKTFLNHYSDEYGPLPIPLLVGILPLVNHRHASFLQHEVPGIEIPDEIQRRLEKSGDNGSYTGIRIAIELTEQMRSFIQGIYLMPAFNRFNDAAEIIETLQRKQNR